MTFLETLKQEAENHGYITKGLTEPERQKLRKVYTPELKRINAWALINKVRPSTSKMGDMKI